MASAASAAPSIEKFLANTYRDKAGLDWKQLKGGNPIVLGHEPVPPGIYLKLPKKRKGTTPNLQLHIYVFDGTTDVSGNSLYWHIKIANKVRKQTTEFLTEKTEFEVAKDNTYNKFCRLPWNLTTLYLNVPFSFNALNEIHESIYNDLRFDAQFLDDKSENPNRFKGNPKPVNSTFFT